MIKKFFLFLLDVYKKAVSPFLPGACRFTPTCSEYSKEAIIRYGLPRGLYLTALRILRCHPFHSGGFDPVK